jgi:hypothetical protein
MEPVEISKRGIAEIRLLQKDLKSSSLKSSEKASALTLICYT